MIVYSNNKNINQKEIMMKIKKVFLAVFLTVIVFFLISCQSPKEIVSSSSNDVISTTIPMPTPSLMSAVPTQSVTATPLQTNSKQEIVNLDNWLGNYDGSIYLSSKNVYMDLIIYKNAAGYFGYLNADEYEKLDKQTNYYYERMLVKVQGSQQEIQLIFSKNIFVDELENGSVFSHYQQDDLVCTIKKANNDSLSTTWTNIQQDENREGNFYKTDSTASVTIRSDEDKNEFLHAFGIEEETKPFYQYYDEDNNELIVDFYYNPEELRGVGIYYGRLTMCGFETVPYEKEQWQHRSPYSLYPENEKDDAFSLRDYKEYHEYNENEQLIHFYSTGIIDGYKDSELINKNVININFTYRDDGTLYEKKCFYNPLVFLRTAMSATYLYDKSGRLSFMDSYITHGSLESFYIYEDDMLTPSYYFSLDHQGWKADAYHFAKCDD